MSSRRDRPRPFRLLSLLAALLMVGAACTTGDGDGAGDVAAPEELPTDAPFRQSPWWPYLSAHVDAEPVDLVGGPITVEASQEEGTVNWVLPGKRRLDPTVFGAAEDPRGTELPAPLVGVPPAAREAAEGGGQQTRMPTPFSDQAEQVEGAVEMTLVDATATDAARTRDRIDFEATFAGPDGSEYRVVVDRAAPHGLFVPTAGGVITNFIQHGVTGWGTRLMPTEWADVAFYGAGALFRDGEMIAENRPTHMMLTEFVRGEGYELAFDDEVNPGGRHLHLMMFPFDRFGSPDPVPTGFELPNGEEQPFLHIMYPGVSVEAAGRVQP